jgi:hypothetical protein
MMAKDSVAGRGWLIAMGVLLILAGCFFTWRLWLSYQKTSASRAWKETPCFILSSKLVSERVNDASPLTHRVEIRYRYSAGGEEHASSRIQVVEAAPTAHVEKARELQQQYPPQSEQVCYVNPQKPAESVLRRGTRAALYSIWFPLLFVIGGLGMLLGVLRQYRGLEYAKSY